MEQGRRPLGGGGVADPKLHAVPDVRAARHATRRRRAQTHVDQLAPLIDRYARKIAYERRARLMGNVVAADFAVRHFTVIEAMLTSAGGSDMCHTLGQAPVRRPCNTAAQSEEEVHATDLCRIVDDARRAVCEEHAIFRPATAPTDGLAPSHTRPGEEAETRLTPQHRARAAMAHAQALWEAAATEEGRKGWCGGDVAICLPYRTHRANRMIE